jgi:uncharacterized protein YehS (DUF1456 family)
LNLQIITSNPIAMTNNDILKKLRVALKLRDEDIMEILMLVDFKVTKSEVNALFRTEEHPNYKECGDQLLRNFLNGLIIYMRGPASEEPKSVPEKENSAKEKPKFILKKAIRLKGKVE